MNPYAKDMGVLRPLGGGDPIPLKKEMLVVGRRPTCDIRLDFENISGKHCELRFIRGVWHVRDLKSTNGTTVNGQKVSHDHGVMPDDELGLASHFFTIDYEPIAPTSLADANAVLEEEMGEPRRVRSLLELAGLETDRSRRNRPLPSLPRRPEKPAEPQTEFEEAPDEYSGAGSPGAALKDEDFFNMISEDLKPPGDRRNPPKK